MTASIRPLVAGNWKMNGLSSDLAELKEMAAGFEDASGGAADGLICTPATLIERAVRAVDGTALAIGGEDCHANETGAHTGDVSAEMIADCGASHVIVGHSERRTDHAETDEMVAEKAKAVWRGGLVAIICIGETEAQRKANETLDVLAQQIAGSVPDSANAENSVVAYEPVWAIGTGLTPTANDVAEAHAHIRERLIERLGDNGKTVRILYGGSVKPSNADELMAVENVNGALIGGASLKAADFLGIAKTYRG
ncbi:triose-phosphate isomerase [Notoacmeibacter sp. MSK16QG-6]|uniref:triose-phosphate isomerase n=1 Tax=Notoacmeibacter sp. MSK16QG-6 TaxID=2957982 RepID=UPI00209E5D69|nr:triose-phosphate isomerase [Notoacmeibacter sp. MSK16QG-6]MCP1199330.1 triose-phosphate isomerase [Notoacmeibacter sp. MSK16QG-6]